MSYTTALGKLLLLAAAGVALAGVAYDKGAASVHIPEPEVIVQTKTKYQTVYKETPAKLPESCSKLPGLADALFTTVSDISGEENASRDLVRASRLAAHSGDADKYNQVLKDARLEEATQLDSYMKLVNQKSALDSARQACEKDLK